MQEKCLTLSGRRVITIPTPGGLIEIHRIPGDNRKLLIKTPDGMDPEIGGEEESRGRALQDNPYLRDQDGKTVPKYGIVGPRMHNGEVDGVCVPTALVLEDARS